MKHVSNINVALAEDHKLIRSALVSLINSLEGFRVDIEADNGQELINCIKRQGKVPDVCIIDINMPVMNGFDTIIELKKIWADIKVLVLTVFDTELYIVRMITYGANGYLLKNADPIEIRKAIEDIYYEGMYYGNKASRNFVHAVQNREIKIPNLTEREMAVLKYVCSDLSYADIALKTQTTTRSVEGLRDSLFRKLNCNSRVGLAMFAIQFGLVPVEVNSSGKGGSNV